MHRLRFVLVLLIAVWVLAACGPSAPEATPSPEPTLEQVVSSDIAAAGPVASPTDTAVEEPTLTPVEMDPPTSAPTEAGSAIPTPDRAFWSGDWRTMPVIPELSDMARAIYQLGLDSGRDPHSFSIIGDCQTIVGEPPYSFSFLGGFSAPQHYNLGSFAYLQETIDHFNQANSFARLRFTSNAGYNVASVLSPIWNDYEACDSHESPLECELRVNNPSIAIINMETWWYDRPAESYAGYLRQIVEYLIANGVVPIIGTKADNLEGDWSLNAAMVQVAHEYDIPVWNFWAAVQDMEGQGLRVDEGDYFHLTFGDVSMFQFQNPNYTRYAWPVRNLTALQALDAVWRAVNDLPPAGP
jgi:hypothetical protein